MSVSMISHSSITVFFSLLGILNFCANNYLGLSSHPEVVKAGIDALKTHGAGLSSVRFICGTQVWWLFYYSAYNYKNKRFTWLYYSSTNGGLTVPYLLAGYS